MNKVILIGRLTRDPEIRYTQSGKAVASFALAVDRGYSRRNQGQDGNATADFIPIVAWEKNAEFAQNYLKKGRLILVEGHMQVRTYEGRDGSKRYVTEVIVERFEFVSSKSQSQQDGNAGYYGNNYNNGNNFASANSAPPAPANPAPAPAPAASAQSQPAAPESFGPPIPDEDIPF